MRLPATHYARYTLEEIESAFSERNAYVQGLENEIKRLKAESRQ